MASASEKQVIIVGIEESDHSFYALKWILDRFFASFGSNSPFKLVIVHARPSSSSVAALAGPAATELLPTVDRDLKRTAAKVVEKAKELCTKKSANDVVAEVVEGDARNVLCDAVERYHASILVVGSHGYGAIKRAVLGSVSDYCSHHANCSVMIVKRPKTKQ